MTWMGQEIRRESRVILSHRFNCPLQTIPPGYLMHVGSGMSDSLRPYKLQTTRLLCPWDFAGKNTGEGCHFLFQGIFLTQGSNPGLLHCRQILYQLSHKGSLSPHRIFYRCGNTKVSTEINISEQVSSYYFFSICLLPHFDMSTVVY